MGVRVLIAAVIGAFTTWAGLITPGYAVSTWCESDGFGCLGWFLLMLPVGIVGGMALAWWLLRLAKVAPAGHIALLAAGLQIAAFALPWTGVRIQLPGGIHFASPVTGAVVYGLAALIIGLRQRGTADAP